jgi:hypothetical protein
MVEERIGLLLRRIEQGLTTASDAEELAMLISRILRYESALREIAVSGSGPEAMKALMALVGACSTEERD